MTAVDPRDPVPFGAWDGGPVSDRVACVREDNPGPMTLDGTNTWVLSEPGSDRAVVVDPGEDDDGSHLRRVVEVAAARGAEVALVLVTHGHSDHVGGADELARLTGAPIRSMVRGRGDGMLRDGEELEVGGLAMRVLATPGHTADSLCIHLPGDRSLLTGDSLLGRGTTVVAHPDGELAAYLSSLDRMGSLVAGEDVRTLLPGHGPVVEDPVPVIDYYRAHRRERLDQVRTALAEGARGVEEVVEVVYADVPKDVWPGARMSVAAQLEYLGLG